MRGKGIGRSYQRNDQRDHPRLCGEKIARKMPEWYEERITPAYAGKSSRPQKFTELTGDHPRLCGEKRFIHS